MSENTKMAFQFKISLKHSDPLIWRRIQVPDSYTFGDLHSAIQDIMGWDESHMHMFEMKDPKTGRKVIFDLEFDEKEEKIREKRYKQNLLMCGHSPSSMAELLSFRPLCHSEDLDLRKFFTTPKQKATYTYDFGDNWNHIIVFERLVPMLPKKQYPVCLKGALAGPPEDSGGVHTYAYRMGVFQDPSHKDYVYYRGLFGDNFDPIFFDPKLIEFKSCPIVVG